MEAILNDIINVIKTFVETSPLFISLIIGFGIIILESIIPVLPLSVFVAINVIAFGSIPALIISWIGTTIGCSLSYLIFRKIRKKAYNHLYNHLNIINFINKVDRISFPSLVCLLAMPFTPAFTVNIAAGLSEMKYGKYLKALLCSKIFMVYFWVFIAHTFLESVTNIWTILEIIGLLIGAYIVSKIVDKKFNI